MKKYPSDGAHTRARNLRRNMTDAEQKVWCMLKSKQLDGLHFRRQVPVGNYVVDFVCHQARLIIEIDGGQHDLSSDREKERSDFLEKQGYRVMRFWNNEVLGNLDRVCEVIVESLRCMPSVTPTQPSPIEGEALERKSL